jgi:hypothetical protein
MTIGPVAHDTKTAELHEQAAKIQATLDAHRDKMHRMARDRKEWIGRQQYWRMTRAQVDEQLRCLVSVHGDTFDVRYGLKPSEALVREQEKVAKLAGVMLQIEEMEKVFRANRWNRFFPCLNADGHIHSSFHGCPSVRATTAMAWYPQLSGKTVEDAVAELGPALCSICFPLAPVEHKSMTLGEVEKDKTRAERDAARAEREAKKAAKNLTPDQQFRDHRGDLVETVARCKQILRDEVDLRDYYKGYDGRHDPHSWHGEVVVAAQKAARVLQDREEDNPGTGASLGEIHKIVTTAETRARRAGARF